MAKLMDLQRKKKPGAAIAARAASGAPLEEPAGASANPPAMPRELPAPIIPAPESAAPSPAVRVPEPPSSPRMPEAPAARGEMDESVLIALPDAAFMNFAYSRFNESKIPSPQDALLAAIENPEIALILKVAKRRNLLGPLLSPAHAGPERISAVPGPVHVGPEAYEATMASDMRATLDSPPAAPPPPVSQPPPAPTRVTKPPPPPPRRRKSSEPPPAPVQIEGVPLSEVHSFILEIRESGESTKQRLERAKEFMQGKVRQIVKSHGLEKFKEAEEAATRKAAQAENGAAVEFTPLERKIADLFELNKLVGWLAKRLKSEGGVHEILEANNGKNGAAAAQPQQAAPPAPAAVPMPAAQAGAAAQKPASSAEAQAETEKPSRASSPPPAPKPRPGAIRRFFSSYTTWSVAGIGAFSGALAYADGFREMAIGAKKLAEMIIGREVAGISTAWAIGAYGAVMATLLSVSLIIKNSMERRRAERALARAERTEQDREKMNYIFSKLSEIVLNYTKTEDQKSQIRQAMRTDDRLFICMYSLHRDSVFDIILEDARVPQKLRGIISQVMIPGLELELMQKRLARFADMIYDPMRLAVFEKTYEDDAVFRIICDEVFRRMNNDYVNLAKARALFNSIENSKHENVGGPLLKALEDDYAIVSSKRK